MTEKQSRFAPKYIVFLLFVVGLVGLDQVTKILVVNNLRPGRDEIKIIDGFLSIIHAQNPGAAFGFLGDKDPNTRLLVFGIFTVVAAGVLIHMLWQLPRSDRFQSAMLGLIFSGAVGNAIDRVHKRTVTDFIKVYTDNASLKTWLLEKVGTNEYPTFNVADSAIVVGVALFLLYYMFLDDSKDKDTAVLDDGDLRAEPPAEDPKASADAR